MKNSCFGMVWLCILALFGLFLYYALWSDKPTGIPLIDQFRRPSSQSSPGKDLKSKPKPRLPSVPDVGQ